METFFFDRIVHETGMAYLLDFGNEEIWLPKSQIEIDLEEQVVDVPEWLAIEKGLL